MSEPKDKMRRKRLWAAVDRAEAKGVVDDSKDFLPTSPWNYLRLDDEETEAFENLNKAIDQFGALCKDIVPSPWMDYDMTPVPESEGPAPYPKPSRFDAGRMCAGCPVMLECDRFASVSRPVHGIWAGKMWFNRRKY
jgi:hypothetical protein